MGDDLTIPEDSKTGALAKFDASQTRMMVAGLAGAIKQAKAMRDWAMGEQAIDALIDLQAAFVAWWDSNIRGAGGKEAQSINAAKHELLSVADATSQTGVTQPQVSRWRGRLEDREGYRLALRKALQTVAMSRDPQMQPTGELPLLDRKYRCIVIDPPWPMQKIERVVAPNQTSDEINFDYATMSETELLDLWGSVIKDVIDDSCHVFVWTTQKFLPMAQRLVEAWGIRYVLNMVWHKNGGFQPIGLPQYNCEFVVYARHGSPKFIDTRDFFCCFDGERREHSRKPDEFYKTINRVTDGPRLDMFSRGSHDGFDAWGNQIDQFLDVADSSVGARHECISGESGLGGSV